MTTPCRLLSTTYSIHSQLPFILKDVAPSGTGGRAMQWWQRHTYRGIQMMRYCPVGWYAVQSGRSCPKKQRGYRPTAAFIKKNNLNFWVENADKCECTHTQIHTYTHTHNEHAYIHILFYTGSILNTGFHTKCHTIDCTHNTFLLLQKHLTSGTELILTGWEIVSNESL